MEIVLSILVGIGLAAACGFRVFLPPLVMSIAALSGHLHLARGFEWIGSWPALAAFGCATLLEIVAYYVPWLDNALDAIATPSAVAAGIVVTAGCGSDMSPFLRWGLAVVAGGGTAALVQLLTVKARALSSAFTLGAANFLVSTGEALSSVVVAVISVLVPFLVGLVLIALGLIAWRMGHRKRPVTAGPAPPGERV
jgi:hypothetical protein